jgi:DNA-binding GntR family transcriptional regulator
MPVPAQIPKVRRALAREEIRSQLQSWIVEGALCPEEVLNDKRLAETFGVSRMPVREALRSLEDQGLVETALNRWTRVAPLRVEQTSNWYTLLATLEALALRTALGTLTADDVGALQVATVDLARASGKNDPLAAARADAAFHSVWVRRAANPQLEKSVEECRMNLTRIEIAYFHSSSDLQRSLAEHRRIIAAIEKGSLRDALHELDRHWQSSVERCLARLSTPRS